MAIFIFIMIFLLFHFIKELFSGKIRAGIYFTFLFLSLLYFAFINMNFWLFITISLLICFTSLDLFDYAFYIFPVIVIFSSSLAFKNDKPHLIFYQIFPPFFVYFIHNLYRRRKKSDKDTKELLLKKSKELSIIRKTSLMLQKTLDYEELIDILLNTLTSGESLNYDRSVIFLFDERMNEFLPYYLKQKNIPNKIFLNVEDNDGEFKNYKLLKIKNSIINPFGKTYDTKEPMVIENIDFNDKVQVLINSILNSDSFGLLPLIEKNHIKGIIFVDNFISSIPVTNEELDNSVSIIHQASTALVNSSLYTQSQSLAYTDSLTGLFNKRYLDFSFEQNLSKLLSKELDLAALVIDVDYFKNYNDTNGHIAGNTVLKRIAELLLAESRNRDVVVRFGGEEFCILLFDIDKEGALGVAERMRNRVEKEPFPNEILQPNKKLTISVGLAVFNGEISFEQFLEKADKALYRAKTEGRNKIIYYGGDNHV